MAAISPSLAFRMKRPWTFGSVIRAGIAAGDLERVCEPCVQLDGRLARPAHGVGLGLAISRDFARGMGGELGVESVAAKGSTVT